MFPRLLAARLSLKNRGRLAAAYLGLTLFGAVLLAAPPACGDFFVILTRDDRVLSLDATFGFIAARKSGA